eukprot:GAFH01001435.1.p1 GENE.GAFH01001435.1~~GAFH01001435.1.p1  ORF type:complete len:498 (-),score=101.92 GAFH01001435.1:142-1611(-)
MEAVVSVLGRFNALVERGAALTGLRIDFFKTVSQMVSMIYFSLLFPYIRSPTAKHVVSTMVGILLVLYMYGVKSFLYLLALPVITYVLIRVGVGRKHPTVILVFTLLYKSAGAIESLMRCYLCWVIDQTGTAMIISQKCISSAWDIYDGLPENGDKVMGRHTQACKIVQMPTFLEYMGYIFFPPTLVVGPGFEMAYYLNACKTKAPSRRFKDALRCYVVAPPMLLPYFVKMPWTSEGLLAAEFRQHSLLYRMMYMHILAWVARFRYYGIWMMAEATIILSGVGWDGQTWEPVTNLHFFGCELATNPSRFLENWNVSVQRLIKYYIHTRGPRDEQGHVMLWMFYVSFGFSALWHGFYPGYYMYFLSFAFLIYSHRQIGHRLAGFAIFQRGPEPRTPARRLWDGLVWLAKWAYVQLSINYLGAAFLLLSGSQSIAAWHALDWWGHVAWIGFIPLSMVTAKALHALGMSWPKPVSPSTVQPSPSDSEQSKTK